MGKKKSTSPVKTGHLPPSGCIFNIFPNIKLNF